MNYREFPAVSGTDARMLAIDPARWHALRALKENGMPDWAQAETTEAMQFGTTFHMALLEPEKYADCAVEMPFVESFAIKAGREIKMKALESAMAIDGGFVLKAQEAYAIDGMRRNAVATLAQAGIRLEKYFAEYPMYGNLHGVTCKGQMDFWQDNVLLDVKTCREIGKCDKTIYWEAYHVQLEHYRKLAEQNNFCVTRMGFLFCENVAPYSARLVWLADWGKGIIEHEVALENSKSFKHYGEIER